MLGVDHERLPEPSVISVCHRVQVVHGSVRVMSVATDAGVFSVIEFEASLSVILRVFFKMRFLSVASISLQFPGVVQVPGIVTAAKTIPSTKKIPTTNAVTDFFRSVSKKAFI